MTPWWQLERQIQLVHFEMKFEPAIMEKTLVALRVLFTLVSRNTEDTLDTNKHCPLYLDNFSDQMSQILIEYFSTYFRFQRPLYI